MWHAFLRWWFQKFFTLEVSEFSAAQSQLVQDFDCGDEEWSVPVSAYIKSNAPLEDMAHPKRQTKVFLFWHRNSIVGYGAIGLARRPLPPPDGPFVNCSIIAFVGMRKQFHGRPRLAVRDERFSSQILNHLIFVARQLGNPQLILYVHTRNTAARRLYARFGFIPSGFVTDEENELMTLRLS